MSTELKSVTPESPATELPTLTQEHIDHLRGGLCVWHADDEGATVPVCDIEAEHGHPRCKLRREVLANARALSSRTHGIYKIPEEVKVSVDGLKYLESFAVHCADEAEDGDEKRRFNRILEIVRGWLSSTPDDTEKP